MDEHGWWSATVNTYKVANHGAAVASIALANYHEDLLEASRDDLDKLNEKRKARWDKENPKKAKPS